MERRTNSCAGFTLIEILVVVAIIGVLSGVVLASLNIARDNAQLSAGKAFSSRLVKTMGTDGLLLAEFLEGSGTNIVDKGVYGITGTLSGPTLSWASGILGNALSFASNGDRATFPVAGKFVLNASRTFTISAWIRPSSVSGFMPIVATQRSSQLFFGLSGNQLRLMHDDGVVSANQAISADKWTHVAVSYDGTTRVATFYINGKQSGGGTNSDTSSYSYSNLYVGYESRFGASFRGLIDEVYIFDRKVVQ